MARAKWQTQVTKTGKYLLGIAGSEIQGDLGVEDGVWFYENIEFLDMPDFQNQLNTPE